MQPLEQDVETLRNIPLFAGLPTARLKLIAYTAEVLHFEPGEVIVQQGDRADAVFIIADGEAEVWVHALDGHIVRLRTLGRHSLLGEIAVLCNGRRTATVQAKDHVVTLKLSAHLFLELLRHSPDIAMQVMRIMAERLEKMTGLLRQHQRQ